MTDSLKSIFGVFIKIPIIIFVSYLIFNIFSFTMVYFKLLSAYQVVSNVVLENNYLPPDEEARIVDYLARVENPNGLAITGALGSVDDIDPTAGAAAAGYNPIIRNMRVTAATTRDRKQYGETCIAGVQCDFRIVWPLQPNEQMDSAERTDALTDSGVGAGGVGWTGDDEATMRNERRDAEHVGVHTITIQNSLPGLKYYADLG